MEAIMKKRIAIVFFLLVLKIVVIQGETMIDIQKIIALYENNMQENYEQKIIEAIKELTLQDINAVSSDGLTSLHYASRYGYTELAEALIKNGADLEIQNYGGFTALDEAMIARQWEIFYLLIAHGAKFQEKEGIDYTFRDLSLPEKIPNQWFDTQPTDGFVPNEETAKQIAEVIWTTLYGDQTEYKPFVVTLLDNETWVVAGTLSGYGPVIEDGKLIIRDSEPLMQFTAGGVPYIKIDKKTGSILGVAHTK